MLDFYLGFQPNQGSKILLPNLSISWERGDIFTLSYTKGVFSNNIKIQRSLLASIYGEGNLNNWIQTKSMQSCYVWVANTQQDLDTNRIRISCGMVIKSEDYKGNILECQITERVPLLDDISESEWDTEYYTGNDFKRQWSELDSDEKENLSYFFGTGILFDKPNNWSSDSEMGYFKVDDLFVSLGLSPIGLGGIGVCGSEVDNTPELYIKPNFCVGFDIEFSSTWNWKNSFWTWELAHYLYATQDIEVDAEGTSIDSSVNVSFKKNNGDEEEIDKTYGELPYGYIIQDLNSAYGMDYLVSYRDKEVDQSSTIGNKFVRPSSWDQPSGGQSAIFFYLPNGTYKFYVYAKDIGSGVDGGVSVALLEMDAVNDSFSLIQPDQVPALAFKYLVRNMIDYPHYVGKYGTVSTMPITETSYVTINSKNNYSCLCLIGSGVTKQENKGGGLKCKVYIHPIISNNEGENFTIPSFKYIDRKITYKNSFGSKSAYNIFDGIAKATSNLIGMNSKVNTTYTINTLINNTFTLGGVTDYIPVATNCNFTPKCKRIWKVQDSNKKELFNVDTGIELVGNLNSIQQITLETPSRNENGCLELYETKIDEVFNIDNQSNTNDFGYSYIKCAEISEGAKTAGGKIVLCSYNKEELVDIFPTSVYIQNNNTATIDPLSLYKVTAFAIAETSTGIFTQLKDLAQNYLEYTFTFNVTIAQIENLIWNCINKSIVFSCSINNTSKTIRGMITKYTIKRGGIIEISMVDITPLIPPPPATNNTTKEKEYQILIPQDYFDKKERQEGN